MLKRVKQGSFLSWGPVLAFLAVFFLILTPVSPSYAVDGDAGDTSGASSEEGTSGSDDSEANQEGQPDPEGGPDGTENSGDTPSLETGEDSGGNETPGEEELFSEENETGEEEPLVPLAASLAPGAVSVTGSGGGLWFNKPNLRLGGQDRYETAVQISKNTYTDASLVKTVVVATGADFPDSLSAASLAASVKAPLLLTQAKTIPASIKTELKRLSPTNIVVVGGTGVINKTVENQLAAMLPKGGKLTRLGGKDRFETSLKVANYGWAKTADHAFIATGMNFPDALSAAAAAGHINAPLILVNGNARALDGNASKYLRDHSVKNVHIAGGTGVVSTQIEAALKKVSGVKSVKRYAGADRFITAAAISNAFFTKSHNTYWANAFNFADALTGAAAAGASGSPLLLVMADCVPSVIYDSNDRVLPSQTTVLGGTGVLKASVQHGNECMMQPAGASAASFNGAKQIYAKINAERFKQGNAAYRLADSKVGTPAYNWAKGKKFQRDGNLKKNQKWVREESVGRAPVTPASQPNYLYSMFIKDSQKGTRQALLRSYGGIRGYLSVGYLSENGTGYGTIYVGIKP